MSESIDQDPLDLFESSLPPLFEQPIIAHSSSFSNIYVHEHPLLPFPIKLGFPNPPARLNNLQAQYLWPSGIYLSHLILTGVVDLGREGQGKGRVLELGAGMGLPGIMALVSMALDLEQTEEKVELESGTSCLGKTPTIPTKDDMVESQEELGTVVATDFGDSGICDILRENYLLVLDTLTSYIRSQSQPQSQSRAKVKQNPGWEVLGYEWGTDPASLLVAPSGQIPRKYSTLLLSDTLFHTSSHLSLLQSIYSLLEPIHGKAYITAGFHGGSRGTVDRFLELARTGGCLVRELNVVKWDPRTESWADVENKVEGEYGEGVVWSGLLTLNDKS
ncbi:Nicotinamide N-methyltransferase-like [Phaffia rhodozyma]|uniref:Nicotinamide N-methyltransferase-like n=1 Tax=Phaffia rhodozyma TaxID=264483 RepID=A0A0F7SJ32_PHARH|nr:Nicotinamide N-methyltransferase-like [Phaffia rhodozyma]